MEFPGHPSFPLILPGTGSQHALSPKSPKSLDLMTRPVTLRHKRKIQELGHYLRSYCHDDQHSWSHFLPWAKCTQNSLRQDTTGLTTFQCILAFQPQLPAVDYWFRVSERVWHSARIHLQCAVWRHKTFTVAHGSNTPTYQPGDKVWQLPMAPTPPHTNQGIRYGWPPGICASTSHAESPCYIGPFPIQRQINEVTYQLQLPPRYHIHPTFHVFLLKRFSPSATGPTKPGAPPPPEILDPPSIYQVQDILDSRRRGGWLEYLIDLGRIRARGKILGGPGRCA
ncbi:uncharacterized protein LOC122135732 [Cyprinus carpio]|uniref:Uncharacterized protein LOC122135732 n=1 Tax=Cyprinus carpio TaxID=7962 RepID=A0A9Q9VVD4_CYPCA|nr:uncharacterized protein LOC122135732 [Cyprinus carpio]